MSDYLYRLQPRCRDSRSTAFSFRRLPEITMLAALCALLMQMADVTAQSTPLKPPIPPQSPTTSLQPPIPNPNPAPSLQSNSPTKAQPITSVAPTTQARFQTLKVDGKVIDLRNLPDSQVLKAKSGKTISVARIRQLQARIDRASTAPMMTAKAGQSLKTLAAAPAGTRISLPSGKIVQSQDLGKIQNIYAKLSVNRAITPIPQQVKNAQAQAVVGQGITLAEAMKRPANDVIQVGSHKYTAEQLRQIDNLLKASPRDPRGLLERAGSGPAAGRAGTTPTIPTGPRLKMQRGTSINEMLAKPDNTILESPSGKIISVAQLKQYMALEQLTPAQLQGKATGRVVEIK